MSEYRYTSTEERVYPDRALVVGPGDIVDWPAGPPTDGHWEPTEETAAELARLAAEETGETPPGDDAPADPVTTTAPTRGGRSTPKE